MLSVAIRQKLLPSLDWWSPFISLLWEWCPWVGLYVSQLQVSLDGILAPERRAPSLSVTRRQLRIENLLWWLVWWHPHEVSSLPEIPSYQIFHRWQHCPYFLVCHYVHPHGRTHMSHHEGMTLFHLSSVHWSGLGSVWEGGQHVIPQSNIYIYIVCFSIMAPYPEIMHMWLSRPLSVITLLHSWSLSWATITVVSHFAKSSASSSSHGGLEHTSCDIVSTWWT